MDLPPWVREQIKVNAIYIVQEANQTTTQTRHEDEREIFERQSKTETWIPDR
jgi:adenylate kinase